MQAERSSDQVLSTFQPGKSKTLKQAVFNTAHGQRTHYPQRRFGLDLKLTSKELQIVLWEVHSPYIIP